MKKLCLFMSLILVFSSGCSKSESKKAIEITVVSSYSSEDGNHQNYVDAYKAYEAKTGNTVKDRSGTVNEEWKARVMADFDNGNEPDVLFYFAGADADSLVTNGKVVPISEIRKYNADYAANMKDSLMPVSTADGRQYAVPVNGYWEGLFINKKVLADCGITVPEENYTWEQFLADCQSIKEKGYTPIACSLNKVPHYWFEYCVFNHGNLANHPLLPKSASDETGSVWTSGLLDIKALFEKGYFPDNTNKITDNEANLLMTEDKAAFMIDGSWKIGWFQDNAADIGNFALTYVPAKGERKPTDMIGGLSMGYYITQKAWDDPEKREACVKFVMEMTTDDVVSTFGAISVTALKNGTNPPEKTDALITSALDLTKGCTGITPAAQDSLSPAARTALFDDIKKIVTGEMAPDKAVENCLLLQ